MRKAQHEICFVVLFLGMMGIFMNFQTVWATQTSESSGTAQSSKATTIGNITKTVTKKNTDVSIETSCGIDGFAAYDNPAVVRITVSYNKDFTGSIRMTPVMNPEQITVAYAEDISLAKGEAKTFSFTPPSIGNSGKINIELLDENEKVIYAETDMISLHSIGENVMVGVLSDDYSALNYFDGILVSDYEEMTTNTLELTTASFPDTVEGLSILDCILIDNYDTANLSDKQYSALKSWVNNGGILILSLGANYQNVLHRFSDEFLSGTLGNLEKKKLTWMTTEGEELALENVDCMEFVLDEGQEMDIFSKDKTVYMKSSGLGFTVVLSYDLGMEPIAGHKDKVEIARSLMVVASVAQAANTLNIGRTSSSSLFYNGTNVAKMMNNAPKPSTVLYGLILVAYVVLVGPVLYLVLKKAKKREKIWLAVPVISLLFTGMVYGTGFLYRVRKPIIDTFSVISLEGEGKAEKVYMNITCPKAKQYRFKLNKEYMNFNYSADQYSYNLFGTEKKEDSFDFMLKNENDGISLLTNNTSTFKDTQFTVNRSGENDVGSLDTDLHFYTSGFDGTVTNNTIYDLKNVVINFENHFYQAGDLKKGETVTVDKKKLLEATYGYGSGTFEALYNSNRNLYSDKNIYKNYQIDTFMESTYTDYGNSNCGCIWAEIGAYKPKVMDEKYGNIYGEGVLFTTLKGEYEDITGAYYPSIDKMAMTADGDFDANDGMMYSNLVTVTYSFEDCKNITELKNLTYGKTLQNYGSAVYAGVSAYNVLSGEYERIFINSDTLNGDELKKYLSDNHITLRYESGEVQANETTVFMPKIAAKGDK